MSRTTEKVELAKIDVLLSPYAETGDSSLQTLLKMKKSGKLTAEMLKSIKGK